MSTLWRALVAIGALVLLAAVVGATERSRPGSSMIGRTFGVVSLDAQLAQVADTMILHNTAPRADELALARRAAVAQPLAPLSFYVLGASAQVRDPAKAIAASIRRDPRFLAGYRWQASTSARAGDIAAATRALIRIAVLSPYDPRIFPALAQLTADPVARAVIKAEIAHGASWRDAYLASLGGSSVDRAIVFEMLQSVGRRPAATSVSRLADASIDDRHTFIATMVAHKDYERAYLAWVQWLPAASQGGVGHVFDGGFKGFDALPPFAWALSDGVGGATAIDPASGLALDYSGTDGAVLAHQLLLLAPGRYRIVTDARFDPVSNENGTAPLLWSLSCEGDARVLAELAVPLEGAPRHVGSATFEVAKGCDAQTLALRVNSADFAKRLSGHIRAVAVEAVR